MNTKRLFLYILIASVSVSALIGIVVILLGNFGEFETKVLLTTGTITVTSILGLACGAYLEVKRVRWLPTTGILLAIASAIMWIFLIWYGTVHSGYFTEVLLTVTLLATACSHISLLSLASLDRRFAWSRWAIHGAVWSLTAILLWIIWTHFDPSDNWVARTMGVLSIVIAALTIVTPVFHKLSQKETGLAEIDSEIEKLRTRIAELEQKRAELV
ncbi:MAG TPA: ABC transporter C-terminal domain-containing protein [Pyrinomonadaceae bacterium]|nr:hypothetical protein [Acidobacteriota bacterium]HQZ95014.1 ABC transporter C-terminal domain-containing protein [Pyrinomonadaceae bacterium]